MMGEFKIKKIVGKTDVTYGICTMGSGGDVGFGKEVAVFINGNEYSCKMHNSVKGRISGFGKVYKENGIKEGDVLEICHDGTGNLFCVKEKNNESENNDWEDDLSTLKIDFRMDDYTNVDLDNKETEPDVEAVYIREKQLQVEELGIEDSESWSGLPYHGCMGAKSASDYAVAADENFIIIKSRRNFCIVNREMLTYEEVQVNASSTNCVNGALVKDKFYWQEQGKGLFSYSLQDRTVVQEYKTKQYEVMGAMYSIKNTSYETPAPCMTIQKNAERPTLKLYVGGEIKQIEKLSSKYVEVGDAILASDGEHRIVLGENRFGEPSKRDIVYNVATREYTPLFEELYNSLDFPPDVMQQIRKCRIYATDLKTNTIVIYDDERLPKKTFVPNSLLILQGASVRRIQNFVREPYSGSHPYNGCGCVYRDCRGHEVGIGLFNQELLYRTSDGSVRELFKTYGACVPENFNMIDNHTAVVKTRENEVAIVDFAKNQKYILKI